MMILACDLGGTRTKIGLVRDGAVLAQTTKPANSGQSLAPQLPALKAAWLRLLAGVNQPLGACSGVSVAFPSLVDCATGRVLTQFGKYADAPSLDLRAWARQEFALPLAIENDARMALIGEWRAGAGRGVDNLVMMTLGTGLGTGAIIGGQVLRGAHSQAGCLGGHLTVRYGGRVCSCGNIGCAEAEASTAFLADEAKARPDFSASALASELSLDFAAVFRQAAAGDPCAVALRDHSLLVWSSLAVSLIHAFDPEALILGGGVMGNEDVIVPAVREHVRRHALTPWGQVRVVASALREQAALVAGEWLLREQFPNLPM
jgi:glucokinase